jgi:hypothetical protein
MYTKFWSENLKRKDHSEYLGINRRIIIEWILQKQARMLWTGFNWLRIGINGRFL